MIENKIDEIKFYHMKNIDSLDMKISAIESNKTSSYIESLSANRNIWPTYKTLKETFQLVKNTPIHPSTAPKSNVSLKQLFAYSIYSPLGSNHQYTLLTAQ